MRHPRLEVEVVPEPVTPHGGLALAAGLVAELKIPHLLNERLSLFQTRRGFDEGTHVLTHVYNLYLGGTCIEDIGKMQGDEGLRRILGAERIPDPTTAGDFLRRFDAEDIDALDGCIDTIQEQVWRRRHGGRKTEWGIVDLDSHVHAVYGAKKEGADFSYKRCYAYHPLVISLAGTQEVLRLINRPGNVSSAEGAAEQLRALLPMLGRHHRELLVRGDSAFYNMDIIKACEEHGARFALVVASFPNLVALAEALPEKRWKPFVTRARRTRRGETKKRKHRKKRKERRRAQARARGKKDLKLRSQQIAEIDYKPSRSRTAYRLIIRRRKIEETEQLEMIERIDYRFVITNLPRKYDGEVVIDRTYERCDQENIIEQLQSGISAMRMPTGSFLANAAFMVCARLAFNLKSWLAQLTSLPDEVMRWEWKRFRYNYVVIAATVILHARRVRVTLHSSHRSAMQIGEAYQGLLH